MNDIVFPIVLTFSYYAAIAIYVLGIQKHMSVPRMTEKFVITDQQNVLTAVVQFILSIAIAQTLGLVSGMIFIACSLVLSLSLLFLLEVSSLASPRSILLQTLGISIPVIHLSYVSILAAGLLLALSVEPEESQSYVKRYDRHISRLTKRYKKMFDKYFSREDKFIADAALAILIMEVLCRPRLFRLMENYLKKTIYSSVPMSTGIMQITSPKLLSDSQSVKLGIAHIKMLDKKYAKASDDYARMRAIAVAYNGDGWYGDYVMPIYEYVSSTP